MKKLSVIVTTLAIAIGATFFLVLMHEENTAYNQKIQQKQKAYDYELRMNNYLNGYEDALEGRKMDSAYIAPNPYKY